jgi:hypothetical protein
MWTSSDLSMTSWQGVPSISYSYSRNSPAHQKARALRRLARGSYSVTHAPRVPRAFAKFSTSTSKKRTPVSDAVPSRIRRNTTSASGLRKGCVFGSFTTAFGGNGRRTRSPMTSPYFNLRGAVPLKRTATGERASRRACRLRKVAPALSDVTLSEFARGDGDELGSGGSRGKMRALHSSSELL